MLGNLSAWPADMPLAVSVDSVMKTVGDVSVSIAEIEEANRQAMEELRAQTPGGVEPPVDMEDITTLCARIGRKQESCYSTSLKPYIAKCEKVLLGGTECTGRCGATCIGNPCPLQRYTQDCHNHDRCADVFGLKHRFCNWIFASAADDCYSAPSCVDSPGVWNITFVWSNGKGNTVVLNIDANRKFSTNDGAVGTWTGTDKTLNLKVAVGCKPVYAGKLSPTRLTAVGAMHCTTQLGTGTWRATKTNKSLAAGASVVASIDAVTESDRRAGHAPSLSEPN